MDEKALNELLECSVCLDRLDSQSKVLPCQHTFCRWCLEEIVSTKKELRCPECRCLVDISIQDLPANILLIRLLEGMKNAARSSGSSSRSSPSRISDKTCSGPSSPAHGHLEAALHSPTQKCSDAPALPCAKALYSYDASEPGDLSFKKGDIILLRKQVDENWYHGELKGQHGFFPATYVQVVNPLLNKEIPSCKALYDFQSDCNERDCLIFQKDAGITVIRRIDDNWIEGKLGEQIGIFPVSFVDLNDAAKMLINFQASLIKNGNSLPNDLSGHTRCRNHAVPNPSSLSASIPPPISSSSSSDHIRTPSSSSSATSRADAEPASSSTSSSSSSSSSSTVTSSSASASHLRTVPKSSNLSVSQRSSNKRHSLTNMSPVRMSPPQTSHRHSMEINGSVTLTTASNTATTSTTQSSVAPTSPRRIPHMSSQETSTKVPVAIYMALYNYKPQKEDEMELTKGDFYSVTEKCQDGWFKGLCLRSGRHGVFPGNYVQTVKMSPAKSGGIGVSRNASSASVSSSSTSAATVNSTETRLVPPPTSHIRTHHTGVSRTHSFPKTSPLASLEYQVRLRNQGIRPHGISHPRPITNITQAQLRSNQSPSINTIAQSRSQSMLITTADEDALASASLPDHQGAASDPEDNDSQSKSNSLPIAGASSETPQNSVTRTPSSVASDGRSPRLSRRHTHTDKCSKYSHGRPSHGHASQGRHSLIPSVLQPTNVNVTPPNMVIGATGGIAQAAGTPARPDKEKKKDKDRLPVSLIKKLSAGIPTRMKKSKSPVPDSSKQNSGAAAAASSSSSSPHRSHASPSSSGGKTSSHHHRSGSAPNEASQGALGATGTSSQHRKSSSVDSPSHQATPAGKPAKVKPLVREKYRCIALYPPQSDSELELKVGEIVYVHRKRDDGWFKGTLQNSGKTGLFPGSFVEKC